MVLAQHERRLRPLTTWFHPRIKKVLTEYAPGFTKVYRDFFKQIHYKMNIQEQCRDTNLIPFLSTFPLRRCAISTKFSIAILRHCEIISFSVFDDSGNLINSPYVSSNEKIGNSYSHVFLMVMVMFLSKVAFS